jgi:hypothetical protein
VFLARCIPRGQDRNAFLQFSFIVYLHALDPITTTWHITKVILLLHRANLTSYESLLASVTTDPTTVWSNEHVVHLYRVINLGAVTFHDRRFGRGLSIDRSIRNSRVAVRVTRRSSGGRTGKHLGEVLSHEGLESWNGGASYANIELQGCPDSNVYSLDYKWNESKQDSKG